MKQRGRKPSLSVVTESPISAKDGPEPLAELSTEQRIEWIQVFNSLTQDVSRLWIQLHANLGETQLFPIAVIRSG